MKIYNYGNDYAFQRKQKQSENEDKKEAKDVDTSIAGAKTDGGTGTVGEANATETQKTVEEPKNQAPEKKVSKKKKAAGNKEAL